MLYTFIDRQSRAIYRGKHQSRAIYVVDNPVKEKALDYADMMT